MICSQQLDADASASAVAHAGVQDGELAKTAPHAADKASAWAESSFPPTAQPVTDCAARPLSAPPSLRAAERAKHRSHGWHILQYSQCPSFFPRHVPPSVKQAPQVVLAQWVHTWCKRRAGVGRGSRTKRQAPTHRPTREGLSGDALYGKSERARPARHALPAQCSCPANTR